MKKKLDFLTKENNYEKYIFVAISLTVSILGVLILLGIKTVFKS